ncbi:DUF418 domain-containing protein [Alkalicoccus chagannorensis]|uniref:DUF418 domain-containing protein n=1 Tax=Alkalicoccus chagannorensis TaxID=427072 RepID=UPI00041DDC64|nr:DUF418 domain-containing protein [Alkalicoccus chagannorensis]
MNKRMDVLDVLRGFALIGILMVNVQLMTSGTWVYEQTGSRVEVNGIDAAAGLIVTIFFEGAFITLFTFLFGVGFHVFMSRAEQKGHPARKLFFRRMTGLLIIGLAHLFLVWMGDILTIYAVTGFLLLFFYQRQAQTMLRWALGLLVLFLMLLFSRLLIPAGQLEAMRQEGKTMGAAVTDAYAEAGSWSWLVFRMTEEVPWVLSESVFLLPFVLGMFLLGMYGGKQGWFEEPSRWKAIPRSVYAVVLLLFAGMAGVVAAMETGFLDAGAHQVFLLDTLTRTAGALLTFLYTAGIVYLFSRVGGRGWWMTSLRCMGRTALTMYLLQSITALTIIYAGDLYGRIGTAGSLLLAVGILFGQILLSRWILSRWKQGPVEYLWRRFTYKTVNEIRRPDSIESASLLLGAGANLLMAGMAWVTYYYSHSEAILLDGNYSFIMFLGVITALQVSIVKARRTKTFPLGQFFYESLYAFMKGLLILGVLLMAASTAVIRIFLYASGSTEGIPMLVPEPIFYYAAACTVICYSMTLFYRRQYRRTGGQSILMRTEQKSTLVDGSLSLGIAAGVFFLMQGGGGNAGFVPYLADAIFVLILALLLVREPVSMIRESVIELAGGALQNKGRQAYFEEVIARHKPASWNVEDVFISKNGSRYMLMIYIRHVDGYFAVEEAIGMKRNVLKEAGAHYPHLYLEIIPDSGSSWHAAETEQVQ